MGKKVLPLHRCERCDFSTKNFYIFKRHKNRCDKELYSVSTQLQNSSTLVPNQEDASITDSVGFSLPPPLVNRNYRCTECGFTTNKSKIFLNHNIESHGAKISVYECTFCEYASKWKHKLERHVKYAHKRFTSEEGKDPEEKEVDADQQTDGTQADADLLTEGMQIDTDTLKEEMQVDADPLTDDHLPSVSGDLNTAESLLENQTSSQPKSKVLQKGFLRISFKPSVRSKILKQCTLTGFKPKSTLKKVPKSYIQVVTGADGLLVYKCKLCLYSSSKKKQTFKHVSACHVNATFFKCTKCDFTTDKRVEFYTHKLSHANMNSGEVFKCHECSYSTYVRKNLNCHSEKHGSENPYKCSLCSYATGKEAALKRHVMNHHQNSARNESLMFGHAPPESVAMEIVPSTSAVEEPMDEDEDDYEEIMPPVRKARRMTCPLCGMSFGRPADLGKHVIARHNMRLNEMRQMVQEGCLDGIKPLTVPPLKLKKVVPGKDKMKCTFCSYTTKWPSDYRRHISVHSVEKRYKCPLCMKKYKYLGDVNVHVRRDHNCEPSGIHVQKIAMVPNKKSSPALFRCPACPYVTKTKMEMEKHSSTHNKEDKTFQCKQCDYQTYWRGDIGRHLYRHHGDLLPKEKNEVDLKDFMIIRPERLAFKRKPKAVRMSEMEGFNPDAGLLEPVTCEPSLDDTSDSLSTTSSHSPKKDAAFLGPVKCEHCPFVTNAASKMKAHVATHFNLKQFKCPICGRRSNWKWDMRKHLKREHPEVTGDVITLSIEEAKTSIEEYLETQPNIRREHHFNVRLENALADDGKKKMKKPFQCSLCKFRSDFRWSVSKHLRTIHPGQAGSIVVLTDGDYASQIANNPNLSNTETPTKSLPSDISSSPSSLDKHHHLRAPSVKNTFRQPVPSGDVNMERPFMCPECGKRCATKGDVKKHYHYAHPSNEVKVIYVPDGTEFLYTSKFSVPHTPSPKPVVKKRYGDIQTIKAPSPLKSKDSMEGSKFSNPKLHGYIKPFKCSVCHHRSNWKWDLKKHLRERHPNSCGYIILMDIAEAKMTYAEECGTVDRNNPRKNEVPSLKPVKVLTTIDDPPTEYLPFNMNQDMSRCRRFKCSACAYRSNWRTDILRHLKRKHGLSKTKVVLLNEEFARSTLSQYKYIRNSRDPFVNDFSKDQRSSSSSGSTQTLKIDEKIWRCSSCTFQATFRSHIIKHMQKHGMKPFQCRICEFCSNFRTNIHRHISKLHGKSDCKPFIHVRIKYSKGFNSDSPEEENITVSVPRVYEKPTVMSEQYIDVFLCRKCNLQFSSGLLCHRHLREKHGCDDKTQCMKFRKRQRVKVPEGEQYILDTETVGQAPIFDKKKNYMCTLCPYKANKRGLLNFHMTYHKPQPFNKYKCKHCPYYVSRPRLLQQHVRLHTLQLNWEKKQVTPQNSPVKNMTSVTPKKHTCEKCPYSTNSKNDMLYHKQFHRPKPSAEFKCDHCDYWVTHRRLLKQHEKCHKRTMMAPPVCPPVQLSPCKSELSENSAVFDTVEIAALKQQFICSKITASLSTNPTCSPTKLAASCSMGFRPGYVVKNGCYRKLHTCRSCPYMNIRARNLRLHEMMHGKRASKHPLLKCPDCDYHVGARGLLAHHMKVHQPSYVQDFNDSMAMQMGKHDSWGDDDDKASDNGEIMPEHKVDTLLEIVRFKKFCCEKCPYASAKRNHFQRHVELHGSRQRFTCDFCDYSVPSKNLLAQHRKLHLMPNQNLLTIQSLSNLQYLTEVPADVALASALPAVDDKKPVTISVTHDHLELYENIPESELEPKKLYRCDRCPYANVKRDHLLTHLKFHMIHSEISCPYCDYSVPNQQFLTQHIRVHFCPLPEFSDWLTQNGQSDRIPKEENLDISEALEVAKRCQKNAGVKVKMMNGTAENKLSKSDGVTKTASLTLKEIKVEKEDGEELMEEDPLKGDFRVPFAVPSTSKMSVEELAASQTDVTSEEVFVCQYCDREIVSSELLLRHEMQHLIGNHYEVSDITAPKPSKKYSDKSNNTVNNTDKATSCTTVTTASCSTMTTESCSTVMTTIGSNEKDTSETSLVPLQENESVDKEKREENTTRVNASPDSSTEEDVVVSLVVERDVDAVADDDDDATTDMEVDDTQ